MFNEVQLQHMDSSAMSDITLELLAIPTNHLVAHGDEVGAEKDRLLNVVSPLSLMTETS